MKFQTKYKICLWKGYVEKGLSLTNYAKYLVAFYALSSQDVLATMIIAAIFGVISFFLGWGWYHYGWLKAEIEVSNNFNLFVKQVRKSINKHR